MEDGAIELASRAGKFGLPDLDADATLPRCTLRAGTGLRGHFETTSPLRPLAGIDRLASANLFLMQNHFITGPQHIAAAGGIMLGG